MRLKIERLRDFERDPSNNFLTRSEMMEAVKELIALREAQKGEQVPVGIVRKVQQGLHVTLYQSIPEGTELFPAPQKPVVPVPVGFLFVVKATGAVIYSIAASDIDGAQLVGPIYGDLAIENAGGKVAE